MRVEDQRLEAVRRGIEAARADGVPDELLDLFDSLVGVFDNACRLVALFGQVDVGSAQEAQELYRGYLEARQRRTLH